MSRDIISSFEKFVEKTKGLDLKIHPERAEALKEYFSNGGVVSIVPDSGAKKWPKLLYPTPMRLKEQLDEKEELKKDWAGKHSDWKKKHFDASIYDLSNNVLKFKETIYWHHVVKYATDKDYRDDAKKVKLRAHLVADPKFKPMVKMFVSDIDYRKQLTQTVEQSIVYEKDKRVAKYADELTAFRMVQSKKNMVDLTKKINELEKQIFAFKEMLKWAKE